ncbi:MAG TPA: cell surface protein SprA, partial [Cytophagales bacterium]|nr:cell surface protein SprA [Cytophagales bacterium]
MQNPTGLELKGEIDTSMNYSIYETIGKINYRPTALMSFEEFNQLQTQQMVEDYFQEKSAGLDGESAISGRNLIPKLYVGQAFDRIFGGTEVSLKPSGFVNLDFGFRYQRTDNPALNIRAQRQGGFEFDLGINMNVVGSVGQKLKITTNFDNQRTFDFQNQFRVEYTGFEEDIIKKIEIGNVGLPLNNTLITGAQNLFGVKTQWQFGNLYVTGVASTQRSTQEQICIEGGVQGRQFELRGSDYDENRHFFLGHFFRDNYERWLANLPTVTSSVNVTRVVVYVLNRNQETATLRNFAAFMDLGEGNANNLGLDETGSPVFPLLNGGGNLPSDNAANNLFSFLQGVSRDPNLINEELENVGMVRTVDFEKITGARRLSEQEFTYNRQLGYLSLFRKLQNDEVLAVAYEYTYNGQRYQVGELPENFSDRSDDDVILLKLLRPTQINPRVPTWDLMMKNIYNLGASQLSRENFQLRIIYRDDLTGQDQPHLQEGIQTKDVPLVRIFGMDRLNINGDSPPDGNFDYVDGLTVNSTYGYVLFPVLEPFGRTLQSQFDAEREQALINKFVYDTLYRTTRADAELVTVLNKFYIKGSYQASGGGNNEIMLSAIALTEGTVTVTAGGVPLQEGTQFQVDAFTGRVRILDESIMASGKEICISFEKDDLFNFQRKNLVGLRADYNLSEDINFGATLLHLNEQAQFTRNEIGLEPVSNTNWGLDMNLRKDSRFLTRMVDFLPLIQTKEISTINLQAEFAQLRPGTSNLVDNEGTSYVDDFEEANTPFTMGNNPQANWTLAATPDDGGSNRFRDPTAPSEGLGANYRRAKMAWYQVDNLFYASRNPRPDHLDDDDLMNHYVREVRSTELFPGRDPLVLEANWPIFDLAYFPYERGPYNYNPNLDNNGFLRNPRQNWGGITRAFTTENDFDAVNVEYIEFWMLDPFITDEFGIIKDGTFDQSNTTGGKLIFHLGNVSEDVIPDGRHGFENGLPATDDDLDFVTNDYGRVTTEAYNNDNFINGADGQDAQDVGLDGVSDENEGSVQAVSNWLNALPTSVRNIVAEDPAGDNYRYFLNEDYDQQEAPILLRYKKYNGFEGNTPSSPVQGRGYAEIGNYQDPDNEDLNRDFTLSDLEQYYEYELDLRPGQLRVGEGYIVDRVVASVSGFPEPVSWYLFRIPIRKPDRSVNNIQGFKSIRYIRMVMTDWQQPAVLRFGKFQVVGSKWRKSLENLDELGFGDLPEEEDPDFLTSVVNLNENAQGGPDRVSYVLPPGINQDRDINSPVPRFLNEQALSVCVTDLKDGNTRAVYKNVNMDLVNYGTIKMFLHAESPDPLVEDGDFTAFLRMGTDVTDNYYEIEVPLTMTPNGNYDGESEGDRAMVWPEVNEINMSLDSLFQLKAERNRQGLPETLPYPLIPRQFIGSENQFVTVKGNPDISSVQVLMIGVRNRAGDGLERTVCIWANELRVTDFDQNNGWATNVRLSTKLADLADITTSGRYTTAGYGNIQQKIYERTRDESWNFDVSANVTLDKFFPKEWGIRLPMFVSYERGRSTPFFDPGDPDTPLEVALRAINDETERADYLQAVTADTERRSLNFTNVGKQRMNLEKIPMPYDISNFSLSYAYSEQSRDDFNTFDFTRRRYAGGVVYNYSPPPLELKPFEKIEFLKSPYLELIRTVNFNFSPQNILVQGDLERQFTRTVLRKADLTANFDDPYYEKFFTFNRRYSARWNLTSQLTAEYNATVNALIDEPEGDINTQVKQDSILANIQNLGRMKNFNQTLRANYSVPFNKFPLTDWINADASYDVGYIWTAGSFDQIDSLGNVMENSRNMNLTGRLDFTKLYNKVTYLKELSSPPRPTRDPVADSLVP